VTPVFLGLEDGRLTPDRECRNAVRGALESILPDAIFTLDPNDYHADHRTVGRVVEDIARNSIPLFFCDTLFGMGFQPEYYVDISGVFALKQAALGEHKTQNPAVLLQAVELQNRFRGAQCGWGRVRYAEAFRFATCYGSVNGYTLLPSIECGYFRAR
jgi:LmbE family N-acetylglucosaminyl deacetylase